MLGLGFAAKPPNLELGMQIAETDRYVYESLEIFSDAGYSGPSHQALIPFLENIPENCNYRRLTFTHAGRTYGSPKSS